MAQIQTFQHRDCGEFDIQMILDFALTNNDYSTPLYLAIMSLSKRSEVFPRLLFNETEVTPSLRIYNGSAEGFIVWQEALDPTYYQRPFEERFELANSLAQRNGSAVFRIALDRGSILHSSNKENDEILHVIAASIKLDWTVLSRYPEEPIVGYYETCRERFIGRYKRNIEDEIPH